MILQNRQYQIEIVSDARTALARLAEGTRRIIIVAPTGAGKTVIACMIIQGAVAKGKRVLFLAGARELVAQCSRKLWDFNVPHGLIMRGDEPWDTAVQVASKDTLASWKKRGKIDYPIADVVFVDECHLSLAKGWRTIIEAYPNAVIIGLTATPCRRDGKGLGMLYHAMVQTPPTSWMISNGFLVPIKTYAPYRPNLKGVHSQGGEFVKKEVQAAMDKTALVGDLVQHWRELGEDRLTIGYASGVNHSLHCCEQFNAAGIKAAHIDAKTPLEERDDKIKAFHAGEIKVLWNVDVLTQGVDIPPAACVIDAGPTKSLRKFKQRVGRIMRPFDAKEYAIYLDHAGNVFRHGMPDADIEWSLDSRETVEKKNKPGQPKNPLPIVCPKCHWVFTSRSDCPKCGHRVHRKPLPRESSNGKLVAVNGVNGHGSIEDKERFFKKCLAIMAHKGRTCGAAAAMYSSKMGEPPWESGLPNLPSGSEWKRPVTEIYPGYVR